MGDGNSFSPRNNSFCKDLITRISKFKIFNFFPPQYNLSVTLIQESASTETEVKATPSMFSVALLKQELRVQR